MKANLRYFLGAVKISMLYCRSTEVNQLLGKIKKSRKLFVSILNLYCELWIETSHHWKTVVFNWSLYALTTIVNTQWWTAHACNFSSLKARVTCSMKLKTGKTVPSCGGRLSCSFWFSFFFSNCSLRPEFYERDWLHQQFFSLKWCEVLWDEHYVTLPHSTVPLENRNLWLVVKISSWRAE